MSAPATTEDQTARILAEHGTAVQRATYAIHEARRRYRESTEGQSCPLVWDRARAVQRRELTDALLAFDTEREPGERDTCVIANARQRTAPLTTFEAWCHTTLNRQCPHGQQRGRFAIRASAHAWQWTYSNITAAEAQRIAGQLSAGSGEQWTVHPLT